MWLMLVMWMQLEFDISESFLSFLFHYYIIKVAKCEIETEKQKTANDIFLPASLKMELVGSSQLMKAVCFNNN